jgi:hypothetical protein
MVKKKSKLSGGGACFAKKFNEIKQSIKRK